MLILALIAASSLAAEPAAPAAVTRLLTAIESGNLTAARATLSSDVTIMAEQGDDEASNATLEAFAAFVRGCRRTELTSDSDAEDPTRTAVTVTWTCPSRGSAQAFVWTDPSGVVNIQYGPAPAQ